ncbi:MAG: hypothetical protein ACXVBE_13780, partial [Bdellovibrionota bacterium]
TRYTLEVPTPMRATRLLGLVANGRIAMTRGHTDGPTSSFYGFYNMKKITLLVDQSIRTLRNTAPGANALLQFAERNCPIPQQPTL